MKIKRLCSGKKLIRDKVSLSDDKMDRKTHNKWFHRQVEKAVKEADSPGAAFVSNDDIQGRWQQKRERLLDAIRPENVHPETDLGNPAGKEWGSDDSDIS